ncbi:MAG TPA: class I SAM-dependent methyltransferase [Allosphingosinicella sp.]|nr:class I SAM-dependent methyltransferase [Allosphingosinicella sp.]
MDLNRRQLLAATAALPLLSAAAEPEYDVPYVPTPAELVEKMLDLAGVTASDYLIDLGCGDGRIALAAARRGARALGVDIDPVRIQEAVNAARFAQMESRVVFRRQDLFRTPIYEASVITLYLLPRINLELRPRLLTELRPGSRVVSHAFHMGDWRPEAQEELEGRRIFLWIVPAVAGGSWTLTEANGASWTLEIEQRFQEVSGTLTGPSGALALERPVLRGTRLGFTAGGRAFAGIVGDASIADEGGAWTARRLT